MDRWAKSTTCNLTLYSLYGSFMMLHSSDESKEFTPYIEIACILPENEQIVDFV